MGKSGRILITVGENPTGRAISAISEKIIEAASPETASYQYSDLVLCQLSVTGM